MDTATAMVLCMICYCFTCVTRPHNGLQHIPAMTERTSPPLWHAFVAGAVSGLAARIVTFPADTLKARLQVVSRTSPVTSTGTVPVLVPVLALVPAFTVRAAARRWPGSRNTIALG
eukprot:GHUV01051236.1.p1 GENE.GHUV01051236.1~~GHUV01051236.1.p1  ORF type:complete len:116 (-),score=2.93 GHUV01051236.1:173-520(-)